MWLESRITVNLIFMRNEGRDRSHFGFERTLGGFGLPGQPQKHGTAAQMNLILFVDMNFRHVASPEGILRTFFVKMT